MKKYMLLTGLFLIFNNHFAMAEPIEHSIKASEQWVDVGGYTLFMRQIGQQGPVIILEPGLGDTSALWDKIVLPLKNKARFIIYDRNGLGKSQTLPHENNQPRTAQQVVDNLKQLLHKSNIKPPYILVGHSIGGIYMQLFARENPQLVAGVVLLDSASAEQTGDDPLPPKNAYFYLEAQGIKTSLAQVRAAPPFPSNIPLIVIATEQKGQEWLAIQKRLMQLSKNSTFITTKNSGHYIYLEEPYLVVDAISRLIK